jgi:hypothetical protein
MDHRPTDWSPNDVNRRTVLAAALLMGIGGLVGAAGLLTACGAVIGACRRWYRRVDLTPNELARLKWDQAKAAAGAGAGAWRDTESKTYVPRSARGTS